MLLANLFSATSRQISNSVANIIPRADGIRDVGGQLSDWTNTPLRTIGRRGRVQIRTAMEKVRNDAHIWLAQSPQGCVRTLG